MNRSYGDQCGVARSLDVIGERWALLIVRELLLGPKRFNDLLAGLAPYRPASRSLKRLGPSNSSRTISNAHRSPMTSRLRATPHWSP